MSSNRSIRIALALLAAFGLAAGARPAAAQQAGRIIGRVTDGAGNAVAGATVQLTADGGGATRTATTGETGGFQFDAVPAGTHTVRVSAPGHRPRDLRVRIDSAAVRTVIARLPAGGRALAERTTPPPRGRP